MNPPERIGILARWWSSLRKRLRGTQATGVWGETVAEQHVKAKGYRILGRRVRVGRRDELDLVARSPDQVLVFIEVKTRASEDFGRPFTAVDRRKRKALSRAALRYMMRLKEKPNYFRMDVVEVIGAPGGDAPMVRHLENAFALSGQRRIPW
jgi:putative endonuclease